MTAEQRATFDRDGYLIIRGALRPDEAADAREAIDRVYASLYAAVKRRLTGFATGSSSGTTPRSSARRRRTV